VKKMEMLAISGAGAGLIVASIFGVWVQDNINIIVGVFAVVAAIIIYTIIRPLYLAKRGIRAAAEAAEMTKAALREVDPGKAEALFGKQGAGPGIILQDENQRALIREARKSIRKEWAPTMD